VASRWPRYIVHSGNGEPLAEPFQILAKAEKFAKLIASKSDPKDRIWIYDDVTGDVVGLFERTPSR